MRILVPLSATGQSRRAWPLISIISFDHLQVGIQPSQTDVWQAKTGIHKSSHPQYPAESQVMRQGWVCLRTWEMGDQLQSSAPTTFSGEGDMLV